MKQRIEVKCPCCDKRIYIDVEVNNADIVDIFEENRRKDAEEAKRREEELKAKDPELYNKVQAECDQIMKRLEGK